MNYKSIKELINFLSNTLEKDTKLISLKDEYSKYTGNDWTDLINREDTGKYNKTFLTSNDIYDLYLITWLPGQKSPIHDHADNGFL